MLSLLEGVRVLDLCRLIPGSIATSKLADLGAEVIKVEEPPAGDYLRGVPPLLAGVGLSYLMLNRNKKSIGLDLKASEGRDLFAELVRRADVLVEVSRPGSTERLGIDYESMRKVNPALVYCSVSAFGQTGSFRHLPSHGVNIDAAAGLFSIERGPGGRPEIRAASALGIEITGIQAAFGIVGALLARTRTGEGRYLDAACWDGAVSVNTEFATRLNFGPEVRYSASLVAGIGPRINVYGTKDDKVLFLSPILRKSWLNFCRVVGREDWNDPRTASGPVDYGTGDPGLRDEIEAIIRGRTLDEWMDTFLAADVPASPVVDVGDLEDWALTRERGMVLTDDGTDGSGVKYLRPPLRVQGEEFTIAQAPPRLGQHTIEILDGLRVDAPTRERLLAAGVIAVDDARAEEPQQ